MIGRRRKKECVADRERSDRRRLRREKLGRYLHTESYSRISGKREQRKRRSKFNFRIFYAVCAAVFFLVGLYFVLF